MMAWGGERFQIADFRLQIEGGGRGFGEVIGAMGVVGTEAGSKTGVKRM